VVWNSGLILRLVILSFELRSTNFRVLKFSGCAALLFDTY